MVFCQYICKRNSRHIHKYQAGSIYWILRFIDVRIYCYRSFVLFYAYTQVDIVCAESRCFKPLSWVCERLLFILREINRFLEVLFEFVYSKTPCFSILETRCTRLSILDSRVSTFETWESSFEDRVETVNLHLTGTVTLPTPAPREVLYSPQILHVHVSRWQSEDWSDTTWWSHRKMGDSMQSTHALDKLSVTSFLFTRWCVSTSSSVVQVSHRCTKVMGSIRAVWRTYVIRNVVNMIYVAHHKSPSLSG